jgi:uncharacterized protein Usg
MIITLTKPVLLKVYYFIPEYPMLLQEFSWAFDDHIPELVKTHKFLQHWHTSIDAVISEVFISISGGYTKSYRSVDELLSLN